MTTVIHWATNCAKKLPSINFFKYL